MLTITAFAPLWLGLAVLGIPERAVAFLYLLAVASPLALVAYFRAVRRIGATEERILTVSRRDQDLLAYVATYLVPFAFVSTSDGRSQIVLGLFLALVIGLAIHARIYYVNPLLALARYRIYEVELESGASVVLMTRRVHIPSGTMLQVRTLDQHVYVEA